MGKKYTNVHAEASSREGLPLSKGAATPGRGEPIKNVRRRRQSWGNRAEKNGEIRLAQQGGPATAMSGSCKGGEGDSRSLARLRSRPVGTLGREHVNKPEAQHEGRLESM